MAVTVWLVFLGSLCVGTVDSAGYLGRLPHHEGQCYFEDINKAHFSYDRGSCREPENWCCLHKCWATCGSDERQSPRNIVTSGAKVWDLPLQILGNSSRVPATVLNTGHSPHFTVKHDKSNFILCLSHFYGTCPGDKYVFQDLHIHLGRDERKGSEHAIDGRHYPMEAHMVFYNNKYGNMSNAKSKADGLVVVGVMIQAHNRHKNDDDDTEEAKDEYERGDDNERYDLEEHNKHEDDDDANEEEEDEYERGDDNERSEWEKAHNNRYTYTRECCGRRQNGDEGRPEKKCYKGSGKCKIRFARTLSYLMETYFEKVKEYHNGEKPEHGGEGGNSTDKCDHEICNEKPSDEFIEQTCQRKNNDESEYEVKVDCGISPYDLLPNDQRFYTYQGSLTTPPCYESVQWVMYKCPIRVSRRAFKALQAVKDAEGHPIKEYGVRRPLQNNPTPVFKNFIW
ncbi:nacrein-like protein [Crassostrea virginica]